jgi:hypothetical protein
MGGNLANGAAAGKSERCYHPEMVAGLAFRANFRRLWQQKSRPK